MSRPGSILGTSVRRVEDVELLLGTGTFIANLVLDGLLHVSFVRSTFAHADLVGVDVTDAQAVPGVLAVYTAADLLLAPSNQFIPVNTSCARPPLAETRVRFVGDIVAVVIAEDQAAAEDGANAVVIDYEALPVVVDAEAALLPGAPQLFDAVSGNLAAGARDPVDEDPLATADIVLRARLVNQRVAVAPMEGNAITAIPRDGDHLTVYVSTQLPHMFASLAAPLLGIDASHVRVITPHVGGGFGGKAGVLTEHYLVMACARRIGRPLQWIESRNENLTGMHGRGQIQYVEMGFTTSGEITGLRCRIVGDSGAYAGFGGMLSMGPTRLMAQGVYKIPAITYDVAVAVTNTACTSGFRGAGRPEATAMLERLMDMAADELGLDPVEIRRRNLLPPDVFPYTTLMGAQYDNGDYPKVLDAAIAAAGYDDLRAEQARRRAADDPVQLGIGVATYVEVTGGTRGSEYASVEVHSDGSATVMVGTSGHGQGHPTSFGMIVADGLGIPLDQVQLIQADTAQVPRGGGTGGSRSLQLGGSAIFATGQRVLERGRQVAADLLEASVDDIVLTDDGRLGVAGSPAQALGWSTIVKTVEASGARFVEELDLVQEGATFPFGAHVAVVEVDLETGAVRHVRHIAVDDCGRILNPMIVEGQQHGGIAQGASQVLFEAFTYDEAGNPLTSTLAEYLMPSAADFPSFEASNTETPTHLNPLGAKGIGESGTIGAIPAVHNAVIDAVSHLGIRHIDMPCTPERISQAVRDARAGRITPAWREPLFDFGSLPTPAGPEPAEEIGL